MVFAKNDMATEREEGLQEGLQKGENQRLHQACQG